MDVAVVTVGDELLAGDIENTNATWLCRELADRGVTVARVLVVPDDRETISDEVDRLRGLVDAVVVTGGIGGTPDDVTMAAVADAVGRDLIPNDVVREAVDRRVETIRERYPDFTVDREAEASIPADSRPLMNQAGLSPGCVVENVYVLPGIPREMKPMFEGVADEFSGDSRSVTLYSDTPEAHLVEAIETAGDRFDVSIGCYPDRDAGYNRLKVAGGEDDQIDAAADWLREEIDATDEPPA